MHNYTAGKIIRIIDLSPRVKQFFWEPLEPVNWDFRPGQFCIINFPNISGNMPYRSYSIAGYEGGIVEFCISYKEDGAATTLLWQMKEGDSLQVTEPKGEFILRESKVDKVYFIATGTGIAPFKPMIQQLLTEAPNIEINLIYGNRFKTDVLYQDFWHNLELIKKNFFFHPILSREVLNETQGYVHDVYIKLIKENEKAHFYICGWKEMIKETRQNLKRLGYNRKQYFIESYD